MARKEEITIPNEIHVNLKLSPAARKTISQVKESNMSNITKAVQWIVEDYCRIKNQSKTLTDSDVHEFLHGKE